MSRPYTPQDAERLARARREYEALRRAACATFTLRAAFNAPGFDIDEHCRDFQTNPHGAQAEQDARRFGEQYGIWLPGLSEHCVHMGTFLYPEASAAALAMTLKLFAVDWYFNDTIGRDRVGRLDAAARAEADRHRARLLDVSRTLLPASGPAFESSPFESSPAERACLAILSMLRADAPAAWFSQLVTHWTRHLDVMCRDGNVHARGQVPSVDEIVEERLDGSGMHYTIALAEYVSRAYLDWPLLEASGLAPSIRRLWRLTGTIAGNSNDLFSFEKEFGDQQAEANLVSAFLLAGDGTLHDAMAQACACVQADVREFVALRARLDAALAREDPALPVHRLSQAQRETIGRFVRACHALFKATWRWQRFSKRYKSPRSIFIETREPATSASAPGEVVV